MSSTQPGLTKVSSPKKCIDGFRFHSYEDESDLRVLAFAFRQDYLFVDSNHGSLRSKFHVLRGG